jgi:hypothetical protein
VKELKPIVITEANRCSCGHFMVKHATGGYCPNGCSNEVCEIAQARIAFHALFWRGATPPVYEDPQAYVVPELTGGVK